MMTNYIQIGVERGHIKITADGARVLYVRQGKEYNFRDPEEKVRASFYVELIEKYQYPAEFIDLEVVVPRRTPSDLADIVVFSDADHKKPFIVVECKKSGISKEEERQAIEQAFGNANSLKSVYTTLIAGDFRTAFDVENYPSRERVKNIIADVPIRFGKPQELKYRKNDPKWDLAQADTNQLVSTFSLCHDIIWEGGKKNPAEAFDEMSKIMFCKIRDERETKNNEYYAFQIKTHEEPKSVAKRVRQIYKNARQKDPSVFLTNINLDDHVIFDVVLALQAVTLTKSDIDSKGRAFETFMGRIFRGELGQYFTPREVVKFMVSMVAPSANDAIIDPACGSGGFLLNSLDYVRAELYDRLDPQEAFREEVDFVRYNLFGIEVNEQIARVAMMDMILHGDGHTNIEYGDGLDAFKSYDPKRDIQPGKYSIVLTNPPFGYSVKKKDKAYLDSYVLADGKEACSSQILFIERAHTLVCEGGVVGIVVPDSLTTNSTTQFVRDYIRENFIIEAIVSLPKQTFMPSGAGVKTSLLFLRKMTAQQKDERLKNIRQIEKKIETKRVAELKQVAAVSKMTKRHKDKVEKIQAAFAVTINTEAKQIYDKKHGYAVFMAVAKHVGYDATGKPDKNDLFEIDESGRVDKTKGILGEYRRFLADKDGYRQSDVLLLVDSDHG